MRKPIPYKKKMNNTEKNKANIDPKKIVIVVILAAVSIALCILFTIIFSLVFKTNPYVAAIISAIFLILLSAFIVKQFLRK